MTTHDLKTDPAVFADVLSGAKTFEIRFNDRGFQIGDTLHLLETENDGADMRSGAPLIYTGREVTKTVSHILTGYGLAEGWCCLSFAPGNQAPEGADERAAFEAWGFAQGLQARNDDRGMNYPLGEQLWKAWQARAALAAQHQAEAVLLDGTLLEPLTEEQVSRALQAAGPINASTVRTMARYWKTHPLVAQPKLSPAEGDDLEAWREVIHKAALTVSSFGAYFLGSSKRLGGNPEMREHYAQWHQEANDAVNALMDLRDEMGDAA